MSRRRSLPILALILGAALPAGAGAQGPSAISFSNQLHSLPSGWRAESVAIGDLKANTGGFVRPEIAITAANAATARVFYLQASGANWSSALPGAVPNFPSVSAGERIAGVLVAELGGSSSYRDLAVAYEGSGKVRVKIAPFSPTPPLQTFAWTGARPFRLAALDLERDGDLDIAVLSYTAPHVRFLLNNGSGVFTVSTASITLPNQLTPTAFAAGDFDHNGATDLVIVRADALLTVYRNTTTIFSSSISFTAGQTFGTSNRRRMDVCTGDFGGDAWLDIATPVMYHPSNLEGATVFPNSGPTAFTMSQTPYNIQNLKGFWAIGSGDFDCDGDLDLFVTNVGSNRGYFGENNGSGTFSFTSTTPISLGVFPHDVAVGDLTGDLHADIVTANRGGTTGSVSRLTNLQCNKAFKHVYIGGIPDAYAGSVPTGSEHACPQGGFQTWLGASPAPFDNILCNKRLGHTFPRNGFVFPKGVVAGRLTIRFRTNCPGWTNDILALQFVAGPNRFAWGRRLRTLVPAYASGGDHTVVLDLGNLPGGYNILPRTNTTGKFDVYIQDDTRVDYVRLELFTCECQCRKRFGLKLGGFPWASGASVSLTAYDVPPSNFVFFFLGPQTGALGNTWFCIKQQIWFLGMVQAGTNGVATLPLTLPSFNPPPCSTLSVQGIAWPSFYTSNTWTAQLFP